MVNNTSRTPSFKHTTSELSASPQKPARTYRTSLLRSKSFNVQLGPQHHDRNTFIKSNPQLHKLEKLDESPPPLKSPGIVTSISRSTRDLSKDDDFRPASSFEHRDFAKTNGYTSASSFDSSTSRRPFLRGLKTRTPELYKTLHEDDELDSPSSRLTSTPLRSGRNKLLDYSSSFHSGTSTNPASVLRKPTVSFESDLRTSPASSFLNKGYSTIARISPDKNGDIVDKSVKRSGSNDDYSETVRITSKSTDPLRPSVTNTVQSFSKKTVPSKDGRLETIESSETTRVTKSHFRGDGENDKRYKPKNGSVIIEVRNERKWRGDWKVAGFWQQTQPNTNSSNNHAQVGMCCSPRLRIFVHFYVIVSFRIIVCPAIWYCFLCLMVYIFVSFQVISSGKIWS